MKKKLLLIAPKFNNYEREIETSCFSGDYLVDVIFYDEHHFMKYKGINLVFAYIYYFLRIIFSNFDSLVLKINYRLNKLKEISTLNDFISSQATNYYLNNKVSFEKTLIIKGFGLSGETVEKLKKITAKNGLILYQWDSLHRFPNIIDIYPLFNLVFTFQEKDVKQYPKSIFLPTYCVYNKPKKNNNITQYYDAVFIGIFSVNRFKVLFKLKRKFKREGISYFFYLKWPFRKIAFKNNFILDNKPLESSVSNCIYKNTNCIIDIVHKGQTGLTTRVQEAFYLKKKIVIFKSYFESSTFHLDEDLIFIEDIFSNKIEYGRLKSDSNVNREKYILPIDSWINFILNT